MKLLYLSFSILTIAGFSAYLLIAPNQQEEPLHPKAQSIKDAFEEEFKRTLDPALGYPPIDRLMTAIEETKKRQKQFASKYRSASVANAKFKSRGPSNVGGRTRTILLDLSDPDRNTLFAGGVAGGLWKTEDVTADPVVWEKVNDYLDNLSVGALAQDPDNPQLMYMGTGEGYPNADAALGIGIFKSTDGGENWSLLPNTANFTFRYTRGLIVHPGTGHVYAATQNGGIQRSEDEGNSWTKVLGIALTASSDNMYDIHFVGGKFFASNSNHVYRSETGNRGEWMDISLFNNGFPNNLGRVESTICPTNTELIYIIGSRNGGASEVYRTTNGGASWTQMARPENNGGGEFTNGQAWYDLDLAVDPFNCNHLIAGGVSIMVSTNGGQTWTRFANNMHVDQHRILFDPEVQDRIFFGNDGGFWYSETGSSQFVMDKNAGYITTQFYACDIHPGEFSSYFLGGTQDNGSLQLNDPGVSEARNVRGGDGFYCHIDQDDPSYQIVSSQFGSYGLSTNGGINFSGGVEVNGGFLNPSEYDDDANIVYLQTNDFGDFYRWHILTGELTLVDIVGIGINVTTATADPNTPNRIYFGASGGRVIMVDSAHQGSEVEGELLFNTGDNSTVSSIEVERGNPDHILITLSNYGIQSIYETINGGEDWFGQEGDLPDMPVRWGIFNPKDPTQAMIATETGVWVTELLDGPNTVWIPPVPDRGSPVTRFTMLRHRESDNVVLASSYGRGLFTTDVFADPRVKAYVDEVHYSNSPLEFIGDFSLNAQSYLWNFGDGETSTEENTLHIYDAPGEYEASLTINGSLTENVSVKILEDGALPYVAGAVGYSGDFEGNYGQVGAFSRSGSKFQPGNSEIVGKDGTHSGDNAYVLGLNEQFYQQNTLAYLYTPSFNFSQNGIYTFSFWAKYDIHFGPDGFNVEYSTNRGQTWQVLGEKGETNWYTANSSEVPISAFPQNTPYFTGPVGGFTNYKYNVSFLSGLDDVAFRFVFRSENTGNYRGLAIDDVEVSALVGNLKTELTTFTGDYTDDLEITVNWSTKPEYYCTSFELERSINGKDFETISTIDSKGYLTNDKKNYSLTTNGARSLYYYRLKVINENPDIDYYLEFYSPMIIIRRGEPVGGIFKVFPNPFDDHINLTFNEIIDQDVFLELYDAGGRLVFDHSTFVDGVFLRADLNNQYPAGVYYLSIQVGDREPEVYPLLGGGF